jgi:hypothetical protein
VVRGLTIVLCELSRGEGANLYRQFGPGAGFFPPPCGNYPGAQFPSSSDRCPIRLWHLRISQSGLGQPFVRKFISAQLYRYVPCVPTIFPPCLKPFAGASSCTFNTYHISHKTANHYQSQQPHQALGVRLLPLIFRSFPYLFPRRKGILNPFQRRC